MINVRLKNDYKNEFERKDKCAFTLSEVLITLVIIGVVAALTLPTLVSIYQKTQYVTALKKVYTEVSQVFKLYMADEGVTDLSQTSLYDIDYNYSKLNEILRKYFKVTKLCEWDDSSCSIKESYLDPETGNGTFFQGNSIIYTADGMTFGFGLNTLASCKPNFSNPTSIKGTCICISVDTNGPKPPNQLGRDFFQNQINVDNNGNVYLSGSVEDAKLASYNATGSTDDWWDYYWQKGWSCGSEGSTDTKGLQGYYHCAARIQGEGWNMIY